MPGNLFTNRPNWLFKALGLNDPSVPNTLHMDGVSPVVDVVQSGWASGVFFRGEAECISGNAAIVGPAAFPTLPGGLLVGSDEIVVILGMNIQNTSAGSYSYNLRLSNVAPVPPRFPWVYSATLAAATVYPFGQQTAAYVALSEVCPLIVPPGWGLLESSGPGAGAYIQYWGIRLPAGVKPL